MPMYWISLIEKLKLVGTLCYITSQSDQPEGLQAKQLGMHPLAEAFEILPIDLNNGVAATSTRALYLGLNY